MFLLNAAIFIVVVYSFCIYATNLISGYKKSEYLQLSHEALVSICDEYDKKHDNYYNIILPLYNNADNYNTLSKLLGGGGDTEDNSDPFFRQQIVEMLNWMVMEDNDIVAVLFHRKTDDASFAYYNKKQSFDPAPVEFPFDRELKNKSSAARSVYGVRTWRQAGKLQQTYGIASTLGMKYNRNNMANILVAYDVSRLHSVYRQYSASVSGRYLIVTSDGDVIFDSTGDLYGMRFDRMDLFKENDKTAAFEGEKVNIQTIDRSNRGYYGINIESVKAVNARTTGDRTVIFAIGTGVSLLSAILYLIAGILSSNRVAEIGKAMEYIGSHNLDYRVPVRGKDDEFEHIAKCFNKMCDRLQDNINKLYINEIKQKTAELNALQTGINPHFLYNTLDAIRGKAHKDGNAEVAELIVMMASLLRNLVRSRMFVSIRKELDFCRMYLSIFTLRYADYFNYSFDIEPEVLDYGIPKGTLQPILENYFIHGIHENQDDNWLKISGELKEGFIIFKVQDNGKGIEPSRLEWLKKRLDSMDTGNATYGITNVHERIKLVYGAESGLSIESDNTGTTVCVRIKAMTCAELDQSIKNTNQQTSATSFVFTRKSMPEKSLKSTPKRSLSALS